MIFIDRHGSIPFMLQHIASRHTGRRCTLHRF
jgi:hypothetical protein